MSRKKRTCREFVDIERAEQRIERAFQTALQKGTSKLRRGRVMVVGASRVGKTSLLKRLIGERFDPGEASTIGVEQDMIYTRDISKWRKKDDRAIHSAPADELVRVTRLMAWGVEQQVYEERTSHLDHEQRHLPMMKSEVLQKAQKADENAEELEQEDQMTYHLWDFGGQHVYHITHPIFLTWRAVYILVVNLNQENTANMKDVHFWLKSIYAHAVKAETMMIEQAQNCLRSDEPNIILVGTHADAVRENVQDRMTEIKKEVQQTPYGHQIKHYFDVDNSNEHDPKIEKVREAIDEEMDKAFFMNEAVPTRWVLFENLIHQLVAEKKFYLPRLQLKDELQQLGIEDDEAEAALAMFHHFGKIVYYKNMGIVVLDPQWLNGIITKVIAVVDEDMKSTLRNEWTKFEKRGVLTEKLIDHVWKMDGELRDELLRMMERFDLICEINEGGKSKSAEEPQRSQDGASVGHTMERSFFVPCLAGERLHDREIKEGHEKFSFLIDFHGFLPVGFVHRLFVHIARWTTGKGSHMPRFRTEEMTFYVDEHHQLVMEAIDGKEMKVTMMNVDLQTLSDIEPSLMKEFLQELQIALYQVKARWARRIRYTIGLRCNNCLKYKDQYPKTVPLEEYLGKDLVVCEDCDERIDTITVRRIFEGRTNTPVRTSGCNVLRDVYFIGLAEEIGSEWYALGIRLGISHPELERITEERRMVEHRTLNILQRWRDRSTESDRLKVQGLCDALAGCKRVDLSRRVKSDAPFVQKSDATLIGNLIPLSFRNLIPHSFRNLMSLSFRNLMPLSFRNLMPLSFKNLGILLGVGLGLGVLIFHAYPVVRM